MTPPVIPPPADGGSFGRDVRLVVGAVMLLFNGVLMFLDVYNHEPITWQDVTLHSALLVTALLLMDPLRTIQLLAMVKDKLPIIGSK